MVPLLPLHVLLLFCLLVPLFPSADCLAFPFLRISFFPSRFFHCPSLGFRLSCHVIVSFPVFLGRFIYLSLVSLVFLSFFLSFPLCQCGIPWFWFAVVLLCPLCFPSSMPVPCVLSFLRLISFPRVKSFLCSVMSKVSFFLIASSVPVHSLCLSVCFCRYVCLSVCFMSLFMSFAVFAISFFPQFEFIEFFHYFVVYFRFIHSFSLYLFVS